MVHTLPYDASIKGAMTYLGIGRRKLYEALNSGALKARKNGKRTVILKDDADAYLNSLPHYQPKQAA